MNLFDLVVAKKLAGGGGGGGEPAIEALSVTENGTYTAPSGVDGYNPVTVNVSGGGGEPAIEALSVTENGTYTAPSGVDGYSPVTVNVSGSSYTLLAEADFEANTTSTARTDLGNITLDSQYFSNGFMLYICIRDKAGRRTDYNVGTDTLICMPDPNSPTITILRQCFKCTSSGTDVATANSAANGVYVNYFNKNDMNLTISAKYNPTYSGTINGTYHVAVYALEWPGNVSPFVTE